MTDQPSREGDLEKPPKSRVVCPECGCNLSVVLASLVRQRGRFKAQREAARREVKVLASTLQAAEAERERLEATLLALLKGIGELTEVAQDSRYSDEFVGNLARSLLSTQEPTR